MKAILVAIAMVASGSAVAQQISCEDQKTIAAYINAIAQQEQFNAAKARQLQGMGLVVPPPPEVPIAPRPPTTNPSEGCP